MTVRRALLLHDDPDCRRIYAAALSYAGFDVIETDDPERGFAAVRSAPPSIIVTDLYIQAIADETVVARLRREPHAAGVPIIVISAWSSEPHRRVAEQAGVTTFLRLPVSPGELLTIVLELVGPLPPPDALRSRLTTPRSAHSPK